MIFPEFVPSAFGHGRNEVLFASVNFSYKYQSVQTRDFIRRLFYNNVSTGAGRRYYHAEHENLQTIGLSCDLVVLYCFSSSFF